MSYPGTRALAILLLSSLAFTHCKSEEEPVKGKLLAEAFGEKLTEKELLERVPHSMSEEDSAEIAENAIRNWVREQVLFHEAEQRLDDVEEEVAERVEAYERSLMVHLLEKELVEAKLDSNVTMEDVKEHYEGNKKEYLLDEAVLRADRVQLHKDSISYLSSFVRAMNEGEEGRERLEELCRKHAVHCSLHGDWMKFSALLTQLPFAFEDEERFLERRDLQRYEREGHFFLIRVREHRAPRDTMPLSMAEDRIRRTILNDRRSSIVEGFHQNALIDARKDDKIRIH